MGRNPNVNVNVASDGSFNNNVNDNVDKSKRIRALNNAKHLQSKFGKSAEGSLPFFRKCFNLMSEDKVWSLYESATRKNAGINNPVAYFIGAAKVQPEMVSVNLERYISYLKKAKSICSL